MLKLHTDMRRNGGKYEIRAAIQYIHATATPEKTQDTLKAVRNQLEQAMPTTFKAKYSVNQEGLVVRISGGTAAQANRLMRRVDDILKHFMKHVKL